MSDDDLNISIKELLIRVETNLKSEIGGLKREVETFHERTVPRAEYDTAMSQIRRDLERVEQSVGASSEQSKEELKSFRQDLKDNQTKMIAVMGLIFTAVNFLMTWFVLF